MPLTKEERNRRNAERMKRWRAENAETHRHREKARYYKKKQDAPELLREKTRVAMKRWRAENPDKAKAASRRSYQKRQDYYKSYNLQKRYGISDADWSAIFVSQGGVCAVCKLDSPRGWCLDHCHSTGAVRGILCHPCNTAIGFMGDDAQRFLAAADYLERNASKEG